MPASTETMSCEVVKIPFIYDKIFEVEGEDACKHIQSLDDDYYGGDVYHSLVDHECTWESDVFIHLDKKWESFSNQIHTLKFFWKDQFFLHIQKIIFLLFYRTAFHLIKELRHELIAHHGKLKNTYHQRGRHIVITVPDPDINYQPLCCKISRKVFQYVLFAPGSSCNLISWREPIRDFYNYFSFIRGIKLWKSWMQVI